MHVASLTLREYPVMIILFSPIGLKIGSYPSISSPALMASEFFPSSLLRLKTEVFSKRERFL